MLRYRNERTIKIAVPAQMPDSDVSELREQLQRYFYLVGKYYSHSIDIRQKFVVDVLEQYTPETLAKYDCAVAFSDANQLDIWRKVCRWPGLTHDDTLLKSFVDQFTYPLIIEGFDRKFYSPAVRFCFYVFLAAKTTVRIGGREHLPAMNME